MKIIKTLSEKIKEELKDAEAYIDLANQWKSDEPDTAELFAELSTEELGHMEKLHNAVVKLIENYRDNNGDPPAGMMALYDYMHNQNIENAMRVRIKQGMYRES